MPILYGDALWIRFGHRLAVVSPNGRFCHKICNKNICLAGRLVSIYHTVLKSEKDMTETVKTYRIVLKMFLRFVVSFSVKKSNFVHYGKPSPGISVSIGHQIGKQIPCYRVMIYG